MHNANTTTARAPRHVELEIAVARGLVKRLGYEGALEEIAARDYTERKRERLCAHVEDVATAAGFGVAL